MFTVSSAVGRRETDSGARLLAREIADVGRGGAPFFVLRSGQVPGTG
jgi:hypothetical protein